MVSILLIWWINIDNGSTQKILFHSSLDPRPNPWSFSYVYTSSNENKLIRNYVESGWYFFFFFWSDIRHLFSWVSLEITKLPSSILFSFFLFLALQFFSCFFYFLLPQNRAFKPFFSVNNVQIVSTLSILLILPRLFPIMVDICIVT